MTAPLMCGAGTLDGQIHAAPILLRRVGSIVHKASHVGSYQYYMDQSLIQRSCEVAKAVDAFPVAQRL